MDSSEAFSVDSYHIEYISGNGRLGMRVRLENSGKASSGTWGKHPGAVNILAPGSVQTRKLPVA